MGFGEALDVPCEKTSGVFGGNSEGYVGDGAGSALAERGFEQFSDVFFGQQLIAQSDADDVEELAIVGPCYCSQGNQRGDMLCGRMPPEGFCSGALDVRIGILESCQRKIIFFRCPWLDFFEDAHGMDADEAIGIFGGVGKQLFVHFSQSLQHPEAVDLLKGGRFFIG